MYIYLIILGTLIVTDKFNLAFNKIMFFFFFKGVLIINSLDKTS